MIASGAWVNVPGCLIKISFCCNTWSKSDNTCIIQPWQHRAWGNKWLAGVPDQTTPLHNLVHCLSSQHTTMTEKGNNLPEDCSQNRRGLQHPPRCSVQFLSHRTLGSLATMPGAKKREWGQSLFDYYRAVKVWVRFHHIKCYSSCASEFWTA